MPQPHPDLPRVVRWLAKHTGTFAAHEQNGTLEVFEIGSGKGRRFVPGDIERVEEREERGDSRHTYVVLLLAGGEQLVLARQGFAFAPSFRATGPLAVPAQVLCMRDYAMLFEQLRHAPAGKQALDLIMLLIALLDGARAVGLEVEHETRRVEQVLERVERGEAPDPSHG